jgi:hypothetical protein
MAGIKESMHWYMLGPVALFVLMLRMVLTYFLTRAQVRMPIHISIATSRRSMSAGCILLVCGARLCFLFIHISHQLSRIEDITAVDGVGGAAFRDRLNIR